MVGLFWHLALDFLCAAASDIALEASPTVTVTLAHVAPSSVAVGDENGADMALVTSSRYVYGCVRVCLCVCVFRGTGFVEYLCISNDFGEFLL
jgi:hypothetical protein